jgi:hypothetical protein
VNRGVSISAVTVVALLAAACLAGSSNSATSTTTTLASLSKVALLGDGIGAAHFGQAEGATILELDQELGRPGMLIDEKGNCTIDSSLQWSTVTAYFDKDAFIGYSTSFANGYDREDPNVSTVSGLRVGDTISRAHQLYGTPFSTSLAQGGSWFATTPDGRLDGYLTNEADRRKPVPRIATIEGGRWVPGGVTLNVDDAASGPSARRAYSSSFQCGRRNIRANRACRDGPSS